MAAIIRSAALAVMPGSSRQPSRNSVRLIASRRSRAYAIEKRLKISAPRPTAARGEARRLRPGPWTSRQWTNFVRSYQPQLSPKRLCDVAGALFLSFDVGGI